jgi:tRNA 2-thiouridine synthesizing protein A
MAEQNGKTNTEATPDCRLDITSYVCPMTFVKTKLQLEDMEPGQTLGLKIRLGESYNNVTRSVRDEGHSILGETPAGEHAVELLIQKGKD